VLPAAPIPAFPQRGKAQENEPILPGGHMKQALEAIVLIALAAPALAQMSPLGLWCSIDDKTGEPKTWQRVA
ncbi:MAG TPA: hypothetical protein PLL92_15410, partial [Alicycliphilus sp.]|nr:hypothetical protein [Alicycliphilus sp.]